MDAPKTVDTAYGTVDAAVLRDLKGNLPTSDLLKAADIIEARRLGCARASCACMAWRGI